MAMEVDPVGVKNRIDGTNGRDGLRDGREAHGEHPTGNWRRGAAMAGGCGRTGRTGRTGKPRPSLQLGGLLCIDV